MTSLWRVQQAQMVISIIFWSLTLTGIFYPYIRDRFLNDLIGPENVLLGMMAILTSVILLIFIFGYLYDRFRFWNEQLMVQAERNPYAYGSKLTPIQIRLFEALLNPGDKNAHDKAVLLIQHNRRDPKVRMVLSEIDSEIGGLNESK